MSQDNPTARAIALQAQACAALGSAFSGALLASAADDVAAGGPTAAVMAPWSGKDARAQIADAAPLRLLGALHDLALSGDAPALSALYPSADFAGDAAAAWPVARALLAEHAGRIGAFLGHEPQTNETRRSVALLPGFLTVAAQTGLPIRAFEIAASAGLNSLWDRYHYDLGAAGRWGDAASGVRLDTEWRGGPPPLDAPVRVVERRACDRAPIDVRDPVARRRLKAYIWADQPERLARLDAAVQAVLAADASVDKADAVTWPEQHAGPRDGTVTVLFHSVFWQYMPAESQTALTAAIQRLGNLATAAGPFAWLRMEPPADNLSLMELRLTLWPTGEERLLGRCHPHAAWVEWMG
jgi:hypothetical protein